MRKQIGFVAFAGVVLAAAVAIAGGDWSSANERKSVGEPIQMARHWWQVVCVEPWGHFPWIGTKELGWFPSRELANEEIAKHLRENPGHKIVVNEHWK